MSKDTVETTEETGVKPDSYIVRTFARSLWSADTKNSAPAEGEESETDLESWKNTKSEYFKKARIILRKLKQKGIDVSKPD